MKKTRRKTILLIEDDEPIIDVYTTALEKADHFKVEAIRFGYQVLDWLKGVKQGKTKKPDLILLDLILPDMNGIEVLEEIRKQEETKDIPVFVLTNYSSRELEQMGYDLKSEQYLTKTDYPPSKLIEIIKERVGD